MYTFESAFSKLMDETGIKSASELVRAYVDREDENFSLYHYIQTLRQDIQSLENARDEVLDSIEKYKDEEGQFSSQRNNIMRKREAQAKRQTKMIEEFDENILRASNQLGEIW